jgi:GHH signature containing HNH/Endo VII superfamily nuclease toxin
VDAQDWWARQKAQADAMLHPGRTISNTWNYYTDGSRGAGRSSAAVLTILLTRGAGAGANATKPAQIATKAARPVTYPIEEAGAPLAGGRGTGINRAWAQERELLNAGGGTRNWTADEARELWMTGKVEGYTGHHINSVEAFPEWAGDPRNIRFLKNANPNEHLYSSAGHSGSWTNPTSGNLIDRLAMIDNLRGG